MKIFIFSLLLSLNTIAAEKCFFTTNVLETNRLSVAKEICVKSIDLSLDYFGESKAVVKMTLDGKDVEKSFDLKNVKPRPDGSRLYFVNLESKTTGWSCFEVWDVESKASVVISKDAKSAVVENIQTKLYYNWDGCHGDPEVKQSFFYEVL